MSSILLLALTFSAPSCCDRGFDTQECLPGESTFYISAPFPDRSSEQLELAPLADHSPSLLSGMVTMQFDPKTLRIEGTPADVVSMESLTGLPWTTYCSNDRILNFTHVFSEHENQVVYVAESIGEIQPGSTLVLGSDDGLIVWLNGEKILERLIGRELHTKDELVPVHSDRRHNVFLYKINQGDGGWALSTSLVDSVEARMTLENHSYEIYARLFENPQVQADSMSSILLGFDSRMEIDSTARIKLTLSDSEGVEIDSTVVSANRVKELVHFSAPAKSMKTMQAEILRSDSVVFQLGTFVIPLDSTEFDAKSPKSCDKPTSLALRDVAHELRADTLDVIGPVLKAAMLDALYSCFGLSSIKIRGYESVDFVQPYLLVAPSQSVAGKPLVHFSYGISDKSSFWENPEILSERRLQRRRALSSQSKVVIAITHASGVASFEQQFTEINNRLIPEHPVAPVLVFSRGADWIMTLMQKRDLPFNAVGMISPVLPTNVTYLQSMAQATAKKYPNVKWFVRHGLDDNDAPIHLTRIWVKALLDNGATVDYQEIPHSTHWTFIEDVEKSYLDFVLENLDLTEVSNDHSP